MPREIDQLLVLSLAAEEAVQHQRWDEMADLLRSRDTLLSALEEKPLDPTDAPSWERVRQADARIGIALAEVRSSLVDEIAQAFNTRRAQGAYTLPASTHGTRWDRVG